MQGVVCEGWKRERVAWRDCGMGASGLVIAKYVTAFHEPAEALQQPPARTPGVRAPGCMKCQSQ